MSEKKSDRLRVRDLEAKTERYIMYGYSPYDAELLAIAELEVEEEREKSKDGN